MNRLLLLLTLLTTGAFAADTLHVFTWADYINPDLVKQFEKEHQCKVAIDTFDSNEAMYARLKAGAAGYDLIFPSSYIIPLMAQQDMLQPLDHKQLANLKNVDPEVLGKIADSAMKHGVPYTFGYAVIAYRKDKVKDIMPTWKTFARSDFKKRATLLNDMRETVGAALKSLGYSLNTRDDRQLAEARDVLVGWKKNIAKFDNEGYKAGVDSGEFNVVHGYSGDLWQVMQTNKNVGVVIPVEGVSASCDEMVIPKGAPHPALAHQMINFLLDGKVSAENMENIGYLCPNTAGLKQVDREFLKNPAVTIPAEARAKSEVIQDVGDDLKKYTKVWDEVKAAP
jgi:spermidine/putrescine transport system substrate-binding protein